MCEPLLFNDVHARDKMLKLHHCHVPVLVGVHLAKRTQPCFGVYKGGQHRRRPQHVLDGLLCQPTNDLHFRQHTVVVAVQCIEQQRQRLVDPCHLCLETTVPVVLPMVTTGTTGTTINTANTATATTAVPTAVVGSSVGSSIGSIVDGQHVLFLFLQVASPSSFFQFLLPSVAAAVVSAVVSAVVVGWWWAGW